MPLAAAYYGAMDTIPAVPTLDYVRERRDKILRAATTRQVGNVRIFGSVAQGRAGASSDVDFLVDLPDSIRGFDAFGTLDDLRRDLEEILGYPVDVLTARGPFSSRGQTLARIIADEALPL